MQLTELQEQMLQIGAISCADLHLPLPHTHTYGLTPEQVVHLTQFLAYNNI